MPLVDDLPDDVRELLRDAWTLISRTNVNDAKVQAWRERFHARIGFDDGFGDTPDSDDVP